jgi:hypothetical protein
MTELNGLAGAALYARGSLTGNRAGTTPRVHARADEDKAICGAAPASRASHWMPAEAEITCPKCVVLLRWRATL